MQWWTYISFNLAMNCLDMTIRVLCHNNSTLCNINSYYSLAAKRPSDMPSIIGNRGDVEVVGSADIAINEKHKPIERPHTSTNPYHEAAQSSTEPIQSADTTSLSDFLSATALSGLPQGPTQLEVWAQEDHRHEDIAYRLVTTSPRTSAPPIFPICLEDQQYSSSELKERDAGQKLHGDSHGSHLALEVEEYVERMEVDLREAWYGVPVVLDCWNWPRVMAVDGIDEIRLVSYQNLSTACNEDKAENRLQLC
jgi:hypothetical protein